jgi:hypothetical protein
LDGFIYEHYTYISILTPLHAQNVPVGTFSTYVPVGTLLDFDEPNPTNGAAPVHDPGLSIVTPFDGVGCNDPPGGAPTYSSASLAASLNIFTNISRVSFPVCVFWFEGW